MTVAIATPAPALSGLKSHHRALLAKIPDPGQSAWELSHLHPIPRLTAGQVLIKTTHVALNPFDWQGVAFKYGIGPEARVMGRDGVGRVVEVGSGVQRFKVGDRVSRCQVIEYIAN